MAHPWSRYWHDSVILAKRLIYWHGEPYRIDGHTLRFVPGTRPVRLRYATADNLVSRYDALQILWMWERLSEGDVAVDIGAHVGIYSMLMAAKCGNRGTVIAFEPDPYSRRVIEQNAQLNPKIKPPRVEASACSGHSGMATFFGRHGDGRSALITAVGGEATEAITVPVIALDEYFTEHRLRPRVVKIDAEGAEIRILRGATELLKSDAAILCELHPFAWQKFGDQFSEMQNILTRTGRWMHYLDSTLPLEGEPHYGMVALEKGSPGGVAATG
jgi:FkbM family methyltransferase